MRKLFVVAAVALATLAIPQPEVGAASCTETRALRFASEFCVDHNNGFRVAARARKAGSSNTLVFRGLWSGPGEISSVSIPGDWYAKGYRFMSGADVWVEWYN